MRFVGRRLLLEIDWLHRDRYGARRLAVHASMSSSFRPNAVNAGRLERGADFRTRRPKVQAPGPDVGNRWAVKKEAAPVARRRFPYPMERVYCRMMTTRRLACSFTPSGVGTAGSLSPRPATVIASGEMPPAIKASRTESARRSDNAML